MPIDDPPESRMWVFCQRCGWPRPESDSRPPPKTLLPSALLLRGWTRHPALDADGRIVLPCSPGAVAWSLYGAGDKALELGSRRWLAWFGHVRDILAERHGGVSVQVFNRNAARSKSEVVAVALEAERRAGL